MNTLKPSLSVILNTHNPRMDFLQRTLVGLQAQTLPHAEWELILVDNASDQPLIDRVNLAWHPFARVVLENELGLTLARLCGIHEAQGPVIMFVDDDTILANDYLKNAKDIGDQWPTIGAWGGSINAEFEGVLPPWIDRYRHLLGDRPLKRDSWSNAYCWSEATPGGTGICMRRKVAEFFAQKCLDPNHRTLGRRGKALTSGEDGDMAYCAMDLGFGTARFVCLQMTHLVAATKLTEEYVLRLREAIVISSVLLNQLRPETRQTNPIHRLGPLGWILFWREWLRVDHFSRREMLVIRRAEHRAWQMVHEMGLE
jgi:glycosyltransferase involved in cell wall biosynthesis